MLIVKYASKKEMRGCIGKPLKYIDASMFGPEYSDNGTFAVSNRPRITHVKGREFFAEVTLEDGKIKAVK